MQTIRHIDAIDNEEISIRVIVAHAEMNAPFVSDFICDSTARLKPQELVTASLCFSSRSADDDDHRVRTTGADPLLPEPKELPCFVKQSSPRSLPPPSWSPASPQAARGIGITIMVIITTAGITIMVITIMAITGIGAGTIIIMAIITTTTAIITTTVTTTTNVGQPADVVSAGLPPRLDLPTPFGNRTSGE